jgi:hypothetical protein
MKAWRRDCSSLARVDQDQGEIGGGRAGHHVARVLRVAGRVGDDELAPRRLEIAVGHVDRDALLALRAKAVHEEGQVHVAVTALQRGALHVLELILEDRFRVVEQAADQGRLAVVHGSRGGEAHELRGAGDGRATVRRRAGGRH